MLKLRGKLGRLVNEFEVCTRRKLKINEENTKVMRCSTSEGQTTYNENEWEGVENSKVVQVLGINHFSR